MGGRRGWLFYYRAILFNYYFIDSINLLCHIWHLLTDICDAISNFANLSIDWRGDVLLESGEGTLLLREIRKPTFNLVHVLLICLCLGTNPLLYSLHLICHVGHLAWAQRLMLEKIWIHGSHSVCSLSRSELCKHEIIEHLCHKIIVCHSRHLLICLIGIKKITLHTLEHGTHWISDSSGVNSLLNFGSILFSNFCPLLIIGLAGHRRTGVYIIGQIYLLDRC